MNRSLPTLPLMHLTEDDRNEMHLCWRIITENDLQDLLESSMRTHLEASGTPTPNAADLGITSAIQIGIDALTTAPADDLPDLFLMTSELGAHHHLETLAAHYREALFAGMTEVLGMAFTTEMQAAWTRLCDCLQFALKTSHGFQNGVLV